MNRLRLRVFLAAAILAGCGGPAPKLDTSTDATTDATLKAMTSGMSEGEKKRFQEDCDIAALAAQFGSKPPKGDSPKEKLKSLDGLTVDEIRSKVAPLRVQLSQ